jgi:tRNA threonylcarbamoyladenosine biosynthesis protein TsaE
VIARSRLRERVWSARTPDARSTAELGRVFGAQAPDGAVLLLEGSLGAGKTTLAQGVARGCGVAEPVTSPTYNLILHYGGRRPFTHVDLYRLTDRADLANLDLDEITAAGGVTCIEWPGLAMEMGIVAEPWAEISIDRLPGEGSPDERRLAGRLVGGEWEDLAAALEALGVSLG